MMAAHVLMAQDTVSLKVYFRQGESSVDRSFGDNGSSLDAFIATVNGMQRDSGSGIDYISIQTGSSPEGDYDRNERLAMERARSIRSYIVNNLAVSASQVRTYSLGINWEGFSDMVRARSGPYRDAVLSVLARYDLKTGLGREDSRECLAALQTLDDGEVWEWVRGSGILERLRLASGNVICVMKASEASRRDTVVVIHEFGTVAVTAACDTQTVISLIDARLAMMSTGKSKPTGRRFRGDSLFRQPVFAFRSNLLVPLMNIGVEVPLGNRWSIEADWYSPWVFRDWMNSAFGFYENCFQVQLGYLEARVWLGAKHHPVTGDARYRLRGHSIGFGAGGFHYDLGRDRKGEQGDGIAVGVDYQYAQPLGRGGVHLEFTVGVCGYWRTYQKYNVEDGIWDGDRKIETGRLLADGTRQQEIFVAPFRACVSIVVPIFAKGR